ncbi:MAG: restriction endonuclease [Betaproteobacteria bacterium]|nr:restriction endonuclease [Betaproteobacteria bacterium]
MPRRRKTSPLEDLVSLLALLPWWLSLVLAGVSYVVLHTIAISKAPVATRPDQVGQAMSHAVFAAAAIFGQYILPLLCLLAAGISFFRRKHRTELVRDAAASGAADALDHMTWQDFERVVAETFKMEGYRVMENGGGGPDGGVDLVLRKGTEKFFVQCKQWKAFKVGVDVVRELYGVMAAKGAAGGFVVTSGTFTAEAMAFAQGRNIKLLDGKKLHAMIQRAIKENPALTPVPIPDLKAPETPSCPQCGSAMVLRTAKKGAHAGTSFWGCKRYPGCKGIVNI